MALSQHTFRAHCTDEIQKARTENKGTYRVMIINTVVDIVLYLILDGLLEDMDKGVMRDMFNLTKSLILIEFAVSAIGVLAIAMRRERTIRGLKNLSECYAELLEDGVVGICCQTPDGSCPSIPFYARWGQILGAAYKKGETPALCIYSVCGTFVIPYLWDAQTASQIINEQVDSRANVGS